MLVRNACARGMEDDVAAAYDAPFPTPESKAGARAFPLILPTSPEMPGRGGGQARARGASRRRRPTLVLWADSDPVLPFKVGEALRRADRRRARRSKIDNASHFLQEDAGEEIGRLIADWLGQ